MNRYLARGDFIESSLLNEDEDQDKDVIASPVSYYGLGPLSGAQSDYSPLSTTSTPIKITDMGNTNASALTTAGSAPAKTSGSTQMGSANTLGNIAMADPLASNSKSTKGSPIKNFNATLQDTLANIRESFEGIKPSESAGGKLGNRFTDNAVGGITGIQPSSSLDIVKRPKPAPLSSTDSTNQPNLGTEVDLTQLIADQNKESVTDSERRKEFLRDQSIRDLMGLEDAGFREGTTAEEREAARIEAERLEAERLAKIEAERLEAERLAKEKAAADAAAAAARARAAEEQRKKNSYHKLKFWKGWSDERVKKNIEDNTVGLDAINKVQVKNFEYKTEDELTDFNNPESVVVHRDGVQLGVIAQEIQAILPDMVNEESNGILSVNPENMTWHLVNAVKELSSQVTALQSEVKILKGED